MCTHTYSVLYNLDLYACFYSFVELFTVVGIVFTIYQIVPLTLCKAIAGTIPPAFPECDWRFNEFPNATAHALYVTSLEIMALPISPKHVGFYLFDVIYKGSPSHQHANIRSNIMAWINAVAHVMTSLPVRKI